MSDSGSATENSAITSAQQVHDQVAAASNPEQAQQILRADVNNYYAAHCRPEDQSAFWKQVQELLTKDGTLSRLHIDLSSSAGLKPEEPHPQTGFPPNCQLSKEEKVTKVDGHYVVVLPVESFADVAKMVLNKIDPNGATKQQIAEATQNPAFKGAEAQALAAMYEKFDSLHNLSKDEGILSSPKITSSDLDKFKQIELEHKSAEQSDNVHELLMWGFSNGYFRDNKVLSKEDLSKLQASNPSAADKDIFSFLQDNFKKLADKNGKVSFESIKNYRDTAQSTKEGKLVSDMAFFLNQTGQESDISRRLYGYRDPLMSISPPGVFQGQTGDCYFESPVISVAMANPEFIKDAIRDNHDGSYTVTFPGAKDQPITVTAPTDTELTLYNRGNPTGLWASVLEKAFGKYIGVKADEEQSATFPFGMSPPAPGETWEQPPYQRLADGGDSGKTLELLTGHKTQYLFTDAALPKQERKDQAQTREALLKGLEAAFTDRGTPVKAVVAGSTGFHDSNTPDGFTTKHAFSIIAYFPDGHGGGGVTVLDPATGMRRAISLDQLLSNFTLIYFESH